ncbi:filamentous hemagglutinin N-terminal domain-containing protein [Nostoc sp. C052]|uniref:beta strand repeat-containing protein n=1 Tax=Nostoc sp. C052 TaxID=2576902 RepID=UPI0015C38272|nr:S-layer family protein [Nostoc sp. C052]QLE41831.1 filamentous hemagglutinin N-terminal domain-containing protein [Nostoc sp. C052]
MTIKYALNKCLKFGLTGFLGWLSISLFISKTLAQQSNIVPDNTLGAESSQVISNFQGQPIEVITGGAVRQINLFHSFGEFNVSAGREAYFLSPNADIQNIFARVTGVNRSEILGKLGTFQIINGNIAGSNANLFLINPNGIVFGQNASLDVQGSFVATTASSVKFADDREFSATTPQNAPLLTISVPLGLQFGANPGKITVQGDGTGLRSTTDLIDTNFGLRVPSNQTLDLVGGDINLEGATIKTAGGRIELGSVSGEGLVSLNPTDKGFSLGYGGVQNFGNIQLTQKASVDASGTGAGDVQVTGKRVMLSDGSQIEVSTLGSKNGAELIVNATESVELNNPSSGLFAQVYAGATGNGGNLTISTKNLLVQDGAQVNTDTLGAGNGGNLTVNASGSFQLIGGGLSSVAQPDSTGNAGNITVNAQTINLSNQAIIKSSNAGQGNAGNILLQAQDNFSANNSLILSNIGSPQGKPANGNVGNIEISAKTFSLNNGAQLQAGFFSGGKGNAGIVSVKAQDTIAFTGTNSGIFANVESGAVGNGNDIQLSAKSVSFTDGAVVVTSNAGQGNAGSVSVKAQDTISFTGTNSGISTSVESGAVGNGGDIQISAPSVSLTDFAVLSSGNDGQGNSGNIQLQARSLTLSNGGSVGTQSSGRGNSGDLLVNALDSVSVSGIVTLINPQTREKFTTGSRLATSALGDGNGGELTINTGRLSVLDGGDITTASGQLGRAGNLTINAKDSVEVVGSSLNANPSTISSSNLGSGDAGNLTINTGRLNIQNGSMVSAITVGKGKGGNVNVNASDRVQLIGKSADGRFLSSLLSSNDLNSTGDAGNLTITTKDFLLQDGASVGSSTYGAGKGGDLTITTQDFLLQGTVYVSAGTYGAGKGGNLTVNTQDVLVRDGASIFAGTYGKGQGGDLTINAKDSVDVVGRSPTYNPSIISASTLGSGDAGITTINTGRFSIRDGALFATGTSGAGKGGNLTINAANSVQLTGTSVNDFPSQLSATSSSTGNAGDLTIKTQDLLVGDGAVVSTGTVGAGQGGNLTVNATGSVQLIGTTANGNLPSALSTNTGVGSTGNAGDLRITTKDLFVQDGARVTTATSGTGKGGNLTVNANGTVQVTGTSANGLLISRLSTSAYQGLTGNAGDLTINTQNLLLRDGGQVDAATFGQGKGGNLTVNANSSVKLIGTTANGNFSSGLFATAEVGSKGNAGELTVNTPDLFVRDGAAITTATYGAGKGGNLNVNAANRIQLVGTSFDNRLVSTLSTSANQGSTGNAGNLTIKTQDLLVQDGAVVGASTLSQGNAGNLTVNASRSVQVIGRSADSPFATGLGAAAVNSSGNAGDLTINTPELLVRDGARVSVTNTGTGNAGIMTINSDRINLDNQGSLNANTRSPNKDPNREQATINLNTQNLTLRHGSNITTNATGENVFGGNINIYTTKFFIALENSRISANSDNSRGGRVLVNSQGAFVGTQPSDVSKYITATSGVGLSGTVDVNSADNSSIQNSFTELPPNVIDTNALIANSCISRGTKRQENSFTITGSGALRNSPGDVLISAYTTGDVRSVEPTPRPWKKGDPIIEPQGLYQLPNGQLILSRSC